MTTPATESGPTGANGAPGAVCAVVLAAGAGLRLGTVAKALLRTADGRSFLQAVRDTARAAALGPMVVVVGPPHGAATEAEAWRLGLAAVVNPSPERGMSSSVAVGFGYAQTFFPGAIAALLWPVDHPSVAVATVAAIASRAAPGRVVVPRFGGAERARGGHPTAFGRDLWPALARCHELADGARDVVRADPNRVVRVDVDDRGVIADIDTPADLP